MTQPLKDSTGDVVTLWMKTAKILGKRVFMQTGKKVVNPQQMYALFVISERDGITMKELATQLGITSPSATSLINRLVLTKWVTRVADPENRRLVRLKMASDGQHILQEVTKARAEAMRDVLALLPAKDRSDFARVLTHLHAALVNERRS